MKKILLVEDNAAIRNNTKEILELSNYNVITADNGKIGIEKALQDKPDLIICDIMMPVLDGYAVLHAVQKNQEIKNTPFIFLSAKTERTDLRKGMELGADDYITKPFTGTELLNAVDSRIKKHEMLKNELQPGLKGLNDLMQAGSAKKTLFEFTDGRNINKYKRKQVIYAEGNHPNRLYYITKGKVKVYQTNEDGKELVTELFNNGDFLGHITLLEESVYKDTAVALEDTEVAVIPKEDFDELISKNTDVAKKFIQLLAKNIAAKEKQLLGLAYNSLRKKVANALLMVKQKYAEKEDDKFTINVNRENLAHIAGTATESMIRTLADFKTEKMIDFIDGKIVIINEKKLKNLLN